MSSSPSPYLDIHRSIRTMHRRNRTVANVYGEGLRLSESSALIEIVGCRGISQNELADRLLLSPVAVSRTIKRLVDQGLVKVSIDQADKRKRKVGATPQGLKDTKQIIKWGRVTFQAAYERLKPHEQGFFSRCLSLLCEGTANPEVSVFAEEAPLMAEVRKLTRAYGFLSDSVFDSGLSPLEWQILSSVVSAAEEVCIQDLSLNFSVNLNTVGAAVKRMEVAGLLKKGEGLSDRRRRPLMTSRAGLNLHRKIELAAEADLKHSLRTLSAKDAQKFARLMRIYAGAHVPEKAIVLSADAWMEPVITPQSRSAARSFLILERSRQNLTENAPERFAASDSLIYALYIKGAIGAVVEVQVKGEQVKLLHALSSNLADQSSLDDFIKRTLSELLLSAGEASLEPLEGGCSKAIRSVLKAL